jgi:hypothetical protein
MLGGNSSHRCRASQHGIEGCIQTGLADLHAFAKSSSTSARMASAFRIPHFGEAGTQEKPPSSFVFLVNPCSGKQCFTAPQLVVHNVH